jgi:soluble lytic murein transglycosylase-like protein
VAALPSADSAGSLNIHLKTTAADVTPQRPSIAAVPNSTTAHVPNSPHAGVAQQRAMKCLNLKQQSWLAASNSTVSRQQKASHP